MTSVAWFVYRFVTDRIIPVAGHAPYDKIKPNTNKAYSEWIRQQEERNQKKTKTSKQQQLQKQEQRQQ